MKTRWLALLFLLLVGVPAFGQQLENPTTITAASTSCLATNCAEVSVVGVLAIGINVEGSGTFTLAIEASKNRGTTWYAYNAIDESDPDSLIQQITAAGNYATVNNGITNLRVRASALSSGTPVVTLTRGYLEALNTMGGGGAGGGVATEYTENATDTTITGVVAMMEVAGDAIEPLQGTVADGLLVNLGSNNDVTVTGTVTVTDGAGALNVIVDSSATLTVTATDLDVQSGGADILSTTAFNAAFGTAGSSDTQVLSVQGIASGTALPVSDGGGSITIDGSVSCSNCTGSGASDVDDSSFGVGSDSVAPLGGLFDDNTPDSVDEGDSGVVRMSANRNLYTTLRDAAGNERGANVTAQNELLVELGAGAASIGTLGANSGVDIGDVTLTAGSADIGNVNLEIGGTAITAGAGSVGATTPRVTLASDDPGVTHLATIAGDTTDIETAIELIDNIVAGSAASYAAVRLTDGSSFLTIGADWTASSAIGTTAPGTMLEAKDFDGAALPQTASAAEGDAIPAAGSLTGIQYMMLVSEDGSLQYGTSTTPLVVGDGSGALNTIIDSGTVTTVSTVTSVTGFNSTTMTLNAGAVGAGSPRVTIATDDEINDDIDAIRVADQLIDNASFADEAAFTYATSGVTVIGAIAESTTDTLADGTAGAPVMTLSRFLRTAPSGYATGGAVPVTILSDNTNNDDETAICTGPCTVYSITAFNHAATPAYLRCENDTAANTTPGSETAGDGEPDFAIPGNTAASGFTVNFPVGISYATALTCWIATGEAPTDATDAGEHDVRVLFSRVQ